MPLTSRKKRIDTFANDAWGSADTSHWNATRTVYNLRYQANPILNLFSTRSVFMKKDCDCWARTAQYPTASHSRISCVIAITTHRALTLHFPTARRQFVLQIPAAMPCEP